MNIEQKNNYFCFILIVFAISLFGLFMVYDASLSWAFYKYGDSLYYFKRQLIFYILSVIVFLFVRKISLAKLIKKAEKILLFSFILLILVLIPSVGQVRNGARSWFGFQSFGFQPSELFKITIILFASKYLSNNYENSNSLKNVLPLIIIATLGFLLIMFEPDFGTGLVMLASIIAMLFLSRLKLRYFVYLGIIGAVSFAVLIIIAPYRFERITAFFDPFKDPLGSGFQIIQSLYALGPSGLLGSGILTSFQKQFYLPEPQTDFIFAIIVEELGLLGGLVILLLYGLLIYFGLSIVKNENNLSIAFLKAGMLFEIAIQTTINLMVVVGLLPVTGITLPLISYGGSSLIITMFGLAIVSNKGEKDENIDCSGWQWRSYIPKFSARKLFRK